jgi:hypothetical protein
MKSKIYLVIFTLLFSTTTLFSQKIEKIKGSGLVKITEKEIQAFTSIEVEDNIEINLEKGLISGIKIEADDNLHEIITTTVQNNVLIVSTSKEVHGYKKLSVRITYTNDLNLVTSKGESIVNAIQEIILNTITFKSRNKSKLFLNVNSSNFSLQADDKSKIELNLKSETAFVELNKNSSLQALINSEELKCDLYQKATGIIEGDSTNANLRLDNSAELNARNFNIKNANLAIEGNANCSILAESSIAITATDRAEIALFGTPKIEINKFDGEAKLLKKLPSKK